MKLTGSWKREPKGKKSQGQHARIKTFPGAFDHTPSEYKSSAGTPGVNLPHPGGLQDTPPAPAAEEPAGAWEQEDTALSESMEMQDTLWTEDRFIIQFTDEDGRVLQRSEVSYGEKPVFTEVPPVKAENGSFSYTFAGWSPAIVHATADATYTAVFTAHPRFTPVEDQSAEEERETEDEAEDETDDEEEMEYIPEKDCEPESGLFFSPLDYAAPEAYTPSPDEEPPLPAADPVSTDTEDLFSDTDPDPAGMEDLFSDTAPEPGVPDELLSGSDPGPDDEDAASSEVPSSSGRSDHLLPQLEPVGKTSLTATWQRLEDADGYDIFFAQSGTDFDGIYRSFPSEETSCVFVQLEKRTVWKARVRAYSFISGQKTYIDTSYTLHCITGGSNKKYANAQEVRITESFPDLKIGEKRKIRAAVVGPDDGKQVFFRGRLLRYFSDNPEIASVSAKGKVKGVGTGSCKVWVVAHNGIHAAVDVTVCPGSDTLSFKKKKYSLKTGEKIDLRKKLTFVPEKDPDLLKWKTGDSAVAKVSRKGIVTARKAGQTTVRVEASGGTRARVKTRVNADKKRESASWDSL